jgi:hypothetical protein
VMLQTSRLDSTRIGRPDMTCEWHRLSKAVLKMNFNQSRFARLKPTAVQAERGQSRTHDIADRRGSEFESQSPSSH